MTCLASGFHYYALSLCFLSLPTMYCDVPPLQEEIAEARRKRRLNVLFLGMTRVAEYDSRGGLTKGMKRFDLVERMVRDDVNEANMNPLR